MCPGNFKFSSVSQITLAHSVSILGTDGTAGVDVTDCQVHHGGGKLVKALGVLRASFHTNQNSPCFILLGYQGTRSCLGVEAVRVLEAVLGLEYSTL